MKRINIMLLVLVVGATALTFSCVSKKTSTSNATVGLEVGNEAPDLKFKDPEGKDIALSSLRGKVVLVDFWASWCGPCRKENPTVVSAYEKFKDKKFKNAKGFAIYSVSLDKNADSWKKAIEADKLTWSTHVSDLKYWDSDAAHTYNIRSIPANFLLDAKGVILAKNLRGPALHTEIDKLVK